jgi:DNA-binding LacI/PurR family transcriptional regulator
MTQTIKQIAKEAGVSPQTVSRVVNNHPDVATETRIRVKEVIDRLGYIPNTIAQSLVRQRSNTLGIIISGIEQYGPSNLLAGMAYTAKDLGYKLLVDTVSSADALDAEQVLRGLLAHLVDGIVWAGGEVGDDPLLWEKRLTTLSIPAVFMGNESHTPYLSSRRRISREHSQ